MHKVLLIQPSQYSARGHLIRQKRIYLPGLVFPLLSALTPDNWEVEVRMEVIEDIDYETDADIIGIGAMGHAIFRSFELATQFRRRGKKVFLGGYMASLIPNYALQHVDSVILGDAERSYPKLLRDFAKDGEIDEIYDDQLQDLAGLPIPHYEILLQKKIGWMLPVMAGRGCPHTCSFCSIACLYKGKYMTRPVEEVMRDIKRIKKLGMKSFYLIDDNIVSEPGYLEELCERIKPLKMKWASQCTMNLARNDKLLKKVVESGCKILSLGIESISQDGLAKMNKGWLKVREHEELISIFRKAGIMVSAEMMIGTDSDTTDSLKETYGFIMRNKIPLTRIYILTPIPGTTLYDEYKANGRLIHEDYQHYTASNCVHHPKMISPDELQNMYWWLNRKVFSLKSNLFRTLLNPGILKSPKQYMLAFGTNLHYSRYTRRGDVPTIV